MKAFSVCSVRALSTRFSLSAFASTASIASLGLLALATASVACSSAAPAADTNGGTDAAAPQKDGAAVSTTPASDGAVTEVVIDAGPACNAIPTSAPSVAYTLSDDASPAALTGGTVADGTYYLTSYTIYGAGSVGGGFVANQATSMTLVIAGPSWNQVQVYSIGTTTVETTSTVSTNFTAALSGSAVTLTPTCPQGAAATNGTYAATSSAVQIVTSTGGFTVSETFALQ